MILENSETYIEAIELMEESIKKAIDDLPLIGSFAWVTLGEAHFHLHQGKQLIQAVSENPIKTRLKARFKID